MANEARKKRKSPQPDTRTAKRSRGSSEIDEPAEEHTAGKVQKIFMRNFMCHDALEVNLNPNINFIVGCNGSGKSAILTALTVGLGARANVTSRGTSIKEFIKKGKHTATVEISLINKGLKAFKPDIYGDIITIHRNIGSSSTYKIKNWKGEIISTKREEVDNILYAMNIQIDNPICILNQDVSRTFLVSSKPEERYNLFMRATLLDKIGNEYKEAEKLCIEACQKLKNTNEELSKIRKEIEDLEEKIRRTEEIDKSRKEADQLQFELEWAVAISEEGKLHQAEEKLKTYENNLEKLQEAEASVGSRDEEIEKRIQELEEQVRQAEQQTENSTQDYEQAEQQQLAAKKTYALKSQECRSIQHKIKRLEENINLLKKEIHKVENSDNEEQNERNKRKQRISELEQKLDDIQAMLRTKQTDQMHLEANSRRLSQEIHSAKIEMDNSETRIRKITQDLRVLKQQSDNAFTVFGPNMPRLIKRIEEEHSKGRFKQKPCGPLGAYIKLKDPAWVPAVEDYLGSRILRTFCVDNIQDSKILSGLIKEVFLDQSPPNIICSRFYNKVHNVSEGCTRSPKYCNLLDAMVISNPIVANCLIDQREVECVLLIPTSQEAAEIMSDQQKVPRNCKRAFTQQGDLFFPDPNYRTYGGKQNLRAKFLQVSTAEAIRTLEEDLCAAENSKTKNVATHADTIQKFKRTQSELQTVTDNIRKLNVTQDKIRSEIASLKDKIGTSETISITIYRDELVELEKKLKQEKVEEKRLIEETEAAKREVDSSEAEVKRQRDLRHELNAKVYPLKKKIKQLQDEKEGISIKSQHVNVKLEKARQAIQNATAELEIQQRATSKAVSDATQKCPRINTKRSINQIKDLLKELKGKINQQELQLGSGENLRAEVAEKQAKHGDVLKVALDIDRCTKTHYSRVQHRKETYEAMKKKMGIEIRNAFSQILDLRKYKGSITIDHSNKRLELEVTPQNANKQGTTDTKTLSGGERSYSMVAFILALWECTSLPFYFLDEFDVFMDKVNRRVIMDILLDHSKSHPQNQFTFLTPLDTSNIIAQDYITIHQLQPPERH